MKRIHTNSATCIGCGSCVDMMPSYFYFNEDGRAALYGSAAEKQGESTTLFPDDIALAADTADACPSKCISIFDK